MGVSSIHLEGEKIMEIGKFFDIFALIVSVAMAFVIVSSKNTANIINAWGTAFSGGLKAAEGH